MAPSVGIVGDAARQYGRLGGLVYCGCLATSVISFNSVDSIVYRHSSPRPGRRPLIRTNLDSDGDSCPSTSISNSPASNFSRLREATAFALNACVTLSFVFTATSSKWLYAGRARRCQGIVTSQRVRPSRSLPPQLDLCAGSPAQIGRASCRG